MAMATQPSAQNAPGLLRQRHRQRTPRHTPPYPGRTEDRQHGLATLLSGFAPFVRQASHSLPSLRGFRSQRKGRSLQPAPFSPLISASPPSCIPLTSHPLRHQRIVHRLPILPLLAGSGPQRRHFAKPARVLAGFARAANTDATRVPTSPPLASPHADQP